MDEGVDGVKDDEGLAPDEADAGEVAQQLLEGSAVHLPEGQRVADGELGLP